MRLGYLVAMVFFVLLASPIVSADDIGFGELDNETQAMGDTVVIAGMKPFNLFLFVLRSFASIVCTIFLTLEGYKWYNTKKPTERADRERNMVYILLGLLIIVFGPTVVKGLSAAI